MRDPYSSDPSMDTKATTPKPSSEAYVSEAEEAVFSEIDISEITVTPSGSLASPSKAETLASVLFDPVKSIPALTLKASPAFKGSVPSVSVASWEPPPARSGGVFFSEDLFVLDPDEEVSYSDVSSITSMLDTSNRKQLEPNKSIINLYIDTGLIENSNDKLRNELAANYVFTQKGEESRYAFRKLKNYGNAQVGPEGVRKTFLNDKLGYIAFSMKGITKVNRLAVSTLSIPLIMASSNNIFLNDEHWRKYIIGGNVGQKEYPGLLNKGYIENQVFRCIKPYELRELKQISEDIELEKYDFVEIKSYTNYSLPSYEAFTQTIEDLAIPNFYSIVKHNSFNVSKGGSPPSEKDTALYYSINDVYNYGALNKPVVTPYPPPEDFKRIDVVPIDISLGDYHYIDRNLSMKRYFNTFAKASFDEQVINNIQTNNRTILFPFGLPTEINDLKKNIPYYNSVKIPIRNEYFPFGSFDPKAFPNPKKNVFMNLFNNEYSINLCKALSKNFAESRQGNAESTKNFVVNEEKGKFNPKKQVVENHHTTTTANLRYVDLFEMLTEEANLTLPNTANSILSPNLPKLIEETMATIFFDSMAANSSDPSYRYNKKIKALKTLDKVYRLSGLSLWQNNFSAFPKYNSTGDITNYYPLQLMNDAGKEKYSETIGYRIQKSTTGIVDNFRQPPGIQDVIILKNTIDETVNGVPDHYEFIDTQIKKGVDYTYNVYEYRLVMGLRYTLKNPKVTRKIADDLTDLETPDGAPRNAYCLEFYDPYTFNAVEAVLDTPAYLKHEESTYDTDAQIISKSKFLAEATVEIEPVWRIYEIPLISKEIHNTDHPPHPLEVAPYQRKDDSQIIGFHLLKENFAIHDFPTGLNVMEDAKIEQYLESQNLVSGEQVIDSSRSKVSEIEIFRIDKKPISIKDFNNKLVNRKSLLMKKENFDTDAVFSDCFYEEKIKTNTKLYYTFRAVNLEGVKGSFSPIYEVELIDDGNYKYAVFNKMELAELKPEKMHTEPSKDLKKLLQIIPTPSQIELIDSAVDYTMAAESQMDKVIVGSNSDPIWGKKFKIRMTSKKTGKKIDLNITYKLRK